MPVKDIELILGNDLAGEKVTAVPHMLSNPERQQSSTVELVVYPACAVTRAMAKQAQVAQDQTDRIQAATSGDNGKAETVIDLADSFMAHDQEEVVASKKQDARDDIPPQTMQNFNPATIRREELMGLQEKDTDLSHIWEQVVPEEQAALTQVGHYKRSGILMRQ